MILAFKRSGVLQMVTVISETEKSHLVSYVGKPHKKPKRVSKASKTEKLFDDVYAACDWVTK